MPLMNKETVETDNSDPIYQQISAMSGDQRNKLKMLAQQKISEARIKTMSSGSGGGNLQDIANIFLQQGGVKPIEPKSRDLNDLIMKEYAKKMVNPPEPKKWAPTTREEAIAYAKDVADIKNKSSLMDENIKALPTNSTQEDKQAFLNQLSPKDAALVKSITNYDYDIFRGLSFKDRERVGGLATMYDPAFSMADFNTRQKYKQEFASGKIGANIRSYNTVLGHLGSLYDAVQNQDLPTSSIKLLEKGQRGFANQFQSGGPASKAMASENSAITAVAGELATVFKNSGGTDQEINNWLRSYDKDASREYKQTWLKQGLELVQSRMGAIGYDYERSMGKPYNKSLISPKAQESLQKIEGQNTPTSAGQGNNPEYDAYLKAIGSK